MTRTLPPAPSPTPSPTPARRRRRLVWGALPWLTATVLAALLPGCPFFPENGCFIDRDCANGYVCDARTGSCVAERPTGRACAAPETCSTNETCSRHGTCVPGDCTFSGCVTGYRCDRADGVWACVPSTDGMGGSAGASTDPGGSAGASTDPGGTP